MSVSLDLPTRRAARGDAAIAATDGELLMRFNRYGDEAAFAAIVDRHGKLVWLVCNQVLRQRQDVEDAFQATFLILAQKSVAIRASDSAAAWLFKVAQRTALAARRKRSMRSEEPLAIEPPQGEAALPLLHERQMRYVLMEELRGLPTQYQTTLVMRYLEGRSRRAIAEQTDSTVGQVQGRLARGRRMLRSRLVRRGVSLSMAVGALSVVSANASAAVTPSLVTATTGACLSLKTAGTAAGVSSAVTQLVQEGMKTMWFASVTKMAVVFTSVVAVSAASWTMAAGAGEERGTRVTKRRHGDVIELQVDAEESKTPEAGAPEVTIEAHSPKFEAFAVPEPPEVTVRNLIANQQDEVKKQLHEKVALTNDLELDNLKKLKLQREVTQLHEMKIRLKLAAESEKEEERELRQMRVKQIDDELAKAEAELAHAIMESTSKAAQAEHLAFEVKLAERRLEELMALKLKFEVGTGPEPFSARLRQPRSDVLYRTGPPAEAEPKRVSLDRVSLDEVKQKLAKEVAALRAENAALKKLVEELAPRKADSEER